MHSTRPEALIEIRDAILGELDRGGAVSPAHAVAPGASAHQLLGEDQIRVLMEDLVLVQEALAGDVFSISSAALPPGRAGPWRSVRG